MEISWHLSHNQKSSLKKSFLVPEYASLSLAKICTLQKYAYYTLKKNRAPERATLASGYTELFGHAKQNVKIHNTITHKM